MSMFKQRRGTGRTYRKILGACMAASEGHRVVYIVGNGAEFRHVQNALSVQVPDCTLIKHGSFKFPGEGCIEIRLASENMRGARYTHYVTDELLGLTWPMIEELLDSLHTSPFTKL